MGKQDNQRRKETTRLSNELVQFIDRHMQTSYTRNIHLKNAWEKIATPAMVDHVGYIGYSNREGSKDVLIYVDSSHWSVEINSQKELLRTLLLRESNLEIGKIIVAVDQKTARKKFFKKKEKEE